MPQYFVDSTVIEYVPHNQCRKIAHLFERTPYSVISPETGDPSLVKSGSAKVGLSIDRLHLTPNYIEEFNEIYRFSHKFVLFSCAAAGTKPTHSGYWKNLTEGDFYGIIDLDSMFETHRFYADYDAHTINFWGIKRSEV